MVIFLNLNKREIKFRGEVAKFTANEFKMVEFLFLNKGAISLNEMVEYIWGGRKSVINTNNISQLLCKVRKKIKGCGIDMSFVLMANNDSIIVSKGFYFILRSDNVFIYTLLNFFI